MIQKIEIKITSLRWWKKEHFFDQFFHAVDFFFINEISNWTEIDSHIVNFFQNSISTQNSISLFKKFFKSDFLSN